MKKSVKIAGAAAFSLILLPTVAFGKAAITRYQLDGTPPAVVGQVSAVNGNILTLSDSNNTVYTVDISAAKILKAKTEIAASEIKSGDRISVFGTVNGTNVAASTVIDGQRIGKIKNFGFGNIFGTITAIGNNQLTINSEKDNKTQTINLNDQTVVMKDHTTSTVAALAVGQKIKVKGTSVSGSSDILAERIMIQDMSAMEVKGTVKAVNGNILTVLGSDNITYAIDITNAHRGGKNQETAITVGSEIRVMGKKLDNGTISAFMVQNGQFAGDHMQGKRGMGGKKK